MDELICIIFCIPHKAIYDVDLSLTSLGIASSKSIHVAAGGIILFFFMAE